MVTVGLPVKSRRSENKELTRAAVIEAATVRFADRGYAATTIDEIAVAARVSKGAVYHHFADKATLFEAAFREGQAQLLRNVGSAAASSADPWSRLDAALRAYLDGTVSDQRHRALLQQAQGALGAERCRQLDEDLGLPVLRRALRDLDERGELAGEQPIDLLARVLFSALCQAAMSAGADPQPGRAREEAAQVLTALISGLRRPLAVKVNESDEMTEPPAPVQGTACGLDPRVDEYIDSLPAWQQAICTEVRELVHAADREVRETIKRTRLPYFVLEGNICALMAAKDHVNVFLYDGAIVPDPERIITAGHENKTARTVAIRRDERINAPALTTMLRTIIANNKAGGWRKLKGRG